MKKTAKQVQKELKATPDKVRVARSLGDLKSFVDELLRLDAVEPGLLGHFGKGMKRGVQVV